MSIYFDITTQQSALDFLLNLGFYYGELVMEYRQNCSGDLDKFWMRNREKTDPLNIEDIRFVAFHVTASLDKCNEIKTSGLQNLQYVLSHRTKLSEGLRKCGIIFDIEKQIMYIDGKGHDINYDRCCNKKMRSVLDERIASVSHRVYYDFCVDGFLYNDRVENYGSSIHERPEFISTLIDLSPKAQKLDAFWRANSEPYKVFFYATADQIHKFTFDDLQENNLPYSKQEQLAIKKWMLLKAADRAFEYCHEDYLYIRDDCFIPASQIIRYDPIA